MKLEELKNKKILIVGRGVEGLSAERFLKKHLNGAAIDVVDKKDGENYLDRQKNYDIAVKSPGVKSELITIPYTTATNIFQSNAKGKVIGITGTKGKSTTSTLIYEMLRKSFDTAADKQVFLGGNIGQSPLSFIDKLTDNSWTVLEMSSFQLADTQKSPHIAVILMILQEHLDYHKNIENYVGAKRNILRFQSSEDFAVVNRDYPASNESDILTEGKVFYVSRERDCEQGCFVRNSAIWIRKDGREEEIISIAELKLLGEHNLENACAASMAARLAGVSKENIASVLKTFKGLEHRLEFVGDKNGISFYNDSLATVPQATIEALGTLPDTETLIAGGHDRGLDYSMLGQHLGNGQIKTLILFPSTGARIWKEVCKAVAEANRPEKFDVTTMEQAVRIASSETESGKIVLLSPASASFGIFKDYKDRGEQFKREVIKLTTDN